MSPQYYLAKMTGFSLPCWARSKKHATFKEKNRMGFFLDIQVLSCVEDNNQNILFFLTI